MDDERLKNPDGRPDYFTGNEFDLQGLAEFKTFLQGE